MWRFPSPSPRLSPPHSILCFLFPCCASGTPACAGLLLASVSACWFCGHCSLPAPLSAQPPVQPFLLCRASAARQGARPSLFAASPWPPASKPSPGNENLPPNYCTAFAKAWGLLSAAPHSALPQGSIPGPGAVALRAAWVHPPPPEQPWEVGESSVRQGQQLLREEVRMAHCKIPTVAAAGSPLRPGSLRSHEWQLPESTSLVWEGTSQRPTATAQGHHKEGLINSQPASRESL